MLAQRPLTNTLCPGRAGEQRQRPAGKRPRAAEPPPAQHGAARSTALGGIAGHQVGAVCLGCPCGQHCGSLSCHWAGQCRGCILLAHFLLSHPGPQTERHFPGHEGLPAARHPEPGTKAVTGRGDVSLQVGCSALCSCQLPPSQWGWGHWHAAVGRVIARVCRSAS